MPWQRQSREADPVSARLIDTPAGPLLIVESGGKIAEIRFAAGTESDRDDTPLLRRVTEQITEYFAGARRHFDLPLAPAATAFQARVRAAMQDIPYGQTRSYGELAHSAGGENVMLGTCYSHPMPDVFLRLCTTERLQMKSARDALCNLPQVRSVQQITQFWLSDQNNLQQLLLRCFKICQQANLFK